MGIFFDRIAINLNVNNTGNRTVVFVRLPGYFIFSQHY